MRFSIYNLVGGKIGNLSTSTAVRFRLKRGKGYERNTIYLFFRKLHLKIQLYMSKECASS